MKYYRLKNEDDYPDFEVNGIYKEDFNENPEDNFSVGELAIKYPEDWELVHDDFNDFKFGK